MPSPAELPELVKEFTDLSRDYLLQETVEPAKRLGRFAAYSFAAAVSFAVGVVLLSLAGMRWIVRAMPDGPNWTATGYLISALALVLVALVVIKLTARDTRI